MSLAEVVAQGERLRSLEALRDRLAGDLDRCQSMRDVAALSQRLMDVLAQIEALTGAQPSPMNALDELKQRRRVAGRPDVSGSVAARAPRVAREA